MRALLSNRKIATTSGLNITAMVNSNGEDLMSLSDPTGLQIVAEK